MKFSPSISGNFIFRNISVLYISDLSPRILFFPLSRLVQSLNSEENVFPIISFSEYPLLKLIPANSGQFSTDLYFFKTNSIAVGIKVSSESTIKNNSPSAISKPLFIALCLPPFP